MAKNSKNRLFDEAEFHRVLQRLLKERAGNRPGTYATMIRGLGERISDGEMKAYTVDRIPRLDKAVAIAEAGNITLDELAGRQPEKIDDRYRRALIILLSSKDRVEKIDAFGKVRGLTRDEVFERFVDFLLATEPKRSKK